MTDFEKNCSAGLKDDLRHTFNRISDIPKEKFRDKTFLITGCAGFLGYYFLRFFQCLGEELKIKKIIALDNFMFGEPP